MNLIKRHYLLISIVLCMFLCSTQCNDDVHFQICQVINNTNDTIYIHGALHSGNDNYLDSINPYYIFTIQHGMNLLAVASNESYDKTWIPCWFDDMTKAENEEFLDALKIKFIIYKKSTLRNYSIDSIVNNNIIDKEYIFTYHEMRNMNFKIIYNGD